jgi:DNA processing protein
MDTAERRARAALWSVQGVGPVKLAQVAHHAGPLSSLLEQPVSRWVPLVPWNAPAVAARVAALGTLAATADRLEARCRAVGARLVFPGDRAFPSRLASIPTPPLLLVARGPGAEAPPRRRLAIVGTRRVDSGSLERLHAMSVEAAGQGLGVVSGAADGCDRAAHLGALSARGETWAFLGSALDQIDAGQREVSRQIVEKGGTLWSEYPPGFRSNMNSFTLRNRLISGASDAVLVFRAPATSGALHTARAALAQGRPLLATPGDPWSAACKGSNELLRSGQARPHLDVQDLLAAVGLAQTLSPVAPPLLDLSELSANARAVLDELAKGSADFEALLASLNSLSAGHLSSALVELEVFGAVIHKGGRRYEKR